MSAPAKFLFDDDFGARPERAAEPAISQAAHEAAVGDAEARGYQTGFAACEAEVNARMAAALERIGGTIAALADNMHGIEQRFEAEAVEVAVAVATKLASELVAREPFAEIAALAADCFEHVVGAPHVVVRVNDVLYSEARERLEEIARVRGFGGRLVVLADPDVAPGDCRIEWADGGATRDQTQTAAAIDEVVANYVAVRRSGQS
jgi:flagellar assembly protein FliH